MDGRFSTASDSPMAFVNPLSIVAFLEFSFQSIPLIGIDSHEMGFLALFEGGNAAPWTCPQDDCFGFSGARSRCVKCVDDLVHVVAVDFHGLPAEGAPFIG